MGTFIDLTGLKFHYLTVIERVPLPCKKGDGGGVLWNCKCDCGNETIVPSASLRTGHTKSCGCWQREKLYLIFSMPDGLAARRSLLRSLKFHAEKRGYEYELPDDFAIELMKKDCFYCGSEPQSVEQRGKSTGRFIYNGIDRVDNSKGYIVDNVVPCCKHCNKAKQTRSVNEFLEWVNLVYQHSILKKEGTHVPCER